MADTSIPYSESFYETTLSNAITASQSTMVVGTAPTQQCGYLVIEPKSSNREIVKFTSASGTTLTIVRGLSETASYDDSAGTGKTHAAGTQVAMKDVHYYFNRVVAAFRGDNSSGYNSFAMGDGNTISAANRLFTMRTSSLSAFWGLSSSGKMVVSEDGVTSYVISAGGSGLTAGLSGISITAGAIDVAYLSTGGLVLSGTKIAVGLGDGVYRSSAGVGLDTTAAFTWTGLHNFTGGLAKGGVQLSAAVSAINQAIDGIGTGVTAARLNAVHSDTKLSGATGFHYHGFYHSDNTFEMSAASNVTYVSHTLGAVPRMIRMTAWEATNYEKSYGVSTFGKTPSYLRSSEVASNSATGGTALIMQLLQSAGNNQDATIVSATSGSFYLSFTKGGTPTGTAYYILEVEG